MDKIKIQKASQIKNKEIASKGVEKLFQR